jgi:hypothetical protein
VKWSDRRAFWADAKNVALSPSNENWRMCVESVFKVVSIVTGTGGVGGFGPDCPGARTGESNIKTGRTRRTTVFIGKSTSQLELDSD